MDNRGISEIVGQAEVDGARCAIYRALRDLICAACGGDIVEGEIFTRRAQDVGGLPILPICDECAPFDSLKADDNDFSLLESLLGGDEKAASQGLTESDKKTGSRGDELRQKLEQRLGPVLRRMQRARN
jgi:hypothetical protein